MTRRSLVRFRFSIFSRSLASMYGPFLDDRTMPQSPPLLPLRPAASDNHGVGALVIACLSLYRLTPLRSRLAANRCFSLTTAVRMVARVHRRATNGWSSTAMSIAACLTDDDVFVIDVADLPEGGHAIQVNEPDFTGRHTNLRVIAGLRHQLSRGSG